MTTGKRIYRLGRRCAADFIALLDQLLRAFPLAPAIVLICDNDSIHHARKVIAYLDQHPRLGLLYGARYSPNDHPAERIWAALKNYVANTAVTWPGRLKQIHSFFATAHQIRCWLPPRPGPALGCHRVTSRTLECRSGPGSNTDRDLSRHRTVAGYSNPSTQGHIRQSSAHMPSCSA